MAEVTQFDPFRQRTSVGGPEPAREEEVYSDQEGARPDENSGSMVNPLAQTPIMSHEEYEAEEGAEDDRGSGGYVDVPPEKRGSRSSGDAPGAGSRRRATILDGAPEGSAHARKESTAAFRRRSSNVVGGDNGGQSAFTSMMIGDRRTSRSFRDPTSEELPPPEEDEDMHNYTTADRMEAEQIFMPNMRREKFIPVRIARDKLKQVLSEMAQMKNMHYAALETMERQQEFLKAQLEAAVAQYARKLTKDYNDRVRALENEYRRRLDNLNSVAMGDVRHTVDQVKSEARAAERRLQAQVEQKEREVEVERRIFEQKLAKERGAAQEKDATIADLERRLQEATKGRDEDSGGKDEALEAEYRDLQERFQGLQDEFDALRDENEELHVKLEDLENELGGN